MVYQFAKRILGLEIVGDIMPKLKTIPIKIHKNPAPKKRPKQKYKKRK